MHNSAPNHHPSGGKQLPAGTQLEEFIIERVLGSGGFGITYLARDTNLNRLVIIKENLPNQFAHRDTTSLTIHPGPGREDQENFQWSLENFSKEAAMLASLDHPGIVKVLRSFQAFGTAYFVMPFVEGVALDELILKRRGEGLAFVEEELRGWLERTLDALAHLHDRGIYHRDIKPGNLLITNEGIPVLIDFGSARQRLSERSMTVVESAGYTPFEQLQSRGNVGPWSDLYALGGTLVKVITGEAPPKANDRMRNDPFPSMVAREELASRFSKNFLQSLDRALAVDEEDRWQSAGDWMAALRGKALEQSRAAIPTQEPVTASVAVDPGSSTGPIKKINFIPWIVAACLVLGLFALGKSIFDDRAKATAAQVMEAEQRAAQAEREKQELVAQAKAREEADASEAEKQRAAIAEEERQAQIAQEKAKAKEKAEAEALAKAEMEKRSFAGSKAGEERDFEIAPGVSMTFCWVPAGEFLMGSPVEELGREEDETQHRVRITKGYWMGKYEVTQAQWRACGGVDPSARQPVTKDGEVIVSWEQLARSGRAANFKGMELPVERVSWDEVTGWCQGINAGERSKSGPEAGWSYGLPTEAQWEYAARCGTTTALNSGKNLTLEDGECVNLNEVAWYGENSGFKTHPVGQKRANAWGLYDMHGNVAEWCADWYGSYSVGDLTDPVGATSGVDRVARGGSWSFLAFSCRAARRNSSIPSEPRYYFGFRVVRSSGPVLHTTLLTKDELISRGNELINKGKTADTTNSKVIPPAFRGTWSPEGRTPEPGDVTNTLIDATTFRFYEFSATVISVMIHDGNSITIRSKTSSEGELDIEDWKMTLSENGEKLALENGDYKDILLRNKIERPHKVAPPLKLNF